MFRRSLYQVLRAPNATEQMAPADRTERAPVKDAMSGGGRETRTETTETDDTESEERPTLEQAFRKAVKQHSPKSEQAAAEEDSTRTDTTETAETAAGPKGTKATAGETGLISDEEFGALQTKHKDDPAALRKALEGAFTQKTQKLALERQSVERLQQYTGLVDALESDDAAVVQGAIRQLAEEYGVDLAKGRASTTETETTEDTTTAAIEEAMTEFKTALGPELEYLAEPLMPAITTLVEKLTATTSVAAKVKSLEDANTVVQNERAVHATNDTMKAFGERHPDWQTHEEAMTELSQKLQPVKGMTEAEYLDALYGLVTAPKSKEAIKKAIDEGVAAGVKKHVEKLDTTSETTERRERATPDDQVHSRPSGNPTIREAFAAAKQGIRWD